MSRRTTRDGRAVSNDELRARVVICLPSDSVAPSAETADTVLAQLRPRCAPAGVAPHGPAIQSVFGEGPPGAKTMFVGDQPRAFPCTCLPA